MDRRFETTRLNGAGFPHTRGDGPTDWPRSPNPLLFSPHAWGWTARNPHPPRRPRVFPTRVGMDRRPILGQRRSGGFPHTRGDGPVFLGGFAEFEEFSPHAWGWTVDVGEVGDLLSVFPTRVGMDRPLLTASTVRFRFPHTRGDGPARNSTTSRLNLFSPHAWGWTAALADKAALQRVFPTRVGMDRLAPLARGARAGFPHTRGDGPIKAAFNKNEVPFSPHAWGWTGQRILPSASFNVFPTRVGMDRRNMETERGDVGFPHTRGDGPKPKAEAAEQTSFSPHAWGWTAAVSATAITGAVFPTRVGMDGSRRLRPRARRDLPTRVANELGHTQSGWGSALVK